VSQVGAIPRIAGGIKPSATVTRTPCPVEVSPHKSEGIEPFSMNNRPPCKIGATPLIAGGIEPSATVSKSGSALANSKYQAFTTIDPLLCQGEAVPPHAINTQSGCHEGVPSTSVLVADPISTPVPATMYGLLTKSPVPTMPCAHFVCV